ncbi:replication initiation protein [Gilliamella apicola]|uniref:replication initiation protein n=1 Tax=Gilliamella apicola TaxID=1196095 RepID=UPI003985DD53
MNDLVVYKDNYLIEASYKLTLAEQRLMLYCISKLNPQDPQQKQTITIEEFIKQFPDVKPNNAYKQIKTAIDNLYERSIKVKDPKRTKLFRWIQSAEYQNDEGVATIEFSNSVMPYLCQLERQFTKYQLRNISGFKRTYPIRLYELLTQYRSLKSRIISVLDLRIALQLNDKYKDYKELRKQVIDPSINEINEKSDLKVAYKPIRKGRSIDSLEFYIEVDTQIQMFENQRNIKNLKNQIKKQ